MKKLNYKKIQIALFNFTNNLGVIDMKMSKFNLDEKSL